MKKAFLILHSAFCILNFSVYAQDCNIGNEDTTGFDNLGGFFTANYLLGSSFNLSAAGTLQSINLISQAAGTQVQMAVYDDNSGAPGNLIASGSIGLVAPGITSFPVAPVLLNPGDYWIMAVYAVDEYGICTNATGTNLIYYISLAFGSPLPLNGGGFSNYTGTDMAYFLVITCLTTGEELISDAKSIRVYPNPFTGSATITSGKQLNNATFFLCNLLGEKVKTISNINGESITIDRGNLQSGVYIYEVIEEGNRIGRGKAVIY